MTDIITASGSLGKPEEPTKITPHVLPILAWPNEQLHQECQNVTQYGKWTEQAALDLFTTMKQHGGIGLAAPQCGIMVNIITLWVEQGQPLFFANPKIIEASEEMFEWEEGCLSVPGYFEKRERPNRVTVEYNDVVGVRHTTEFRDLYAFAIQHELDHLNGKLFVDELSRFKKSRARTKVDRFIKQHKELPFDQGL